MVNGHSAFKPTAVLAPNRRVGLTLEAFQPGSDFPSLAMKVLDGVFFRLKTVSSALKSVVPCSRLHALSLRALGPLL